MGRARRDVEGHVGMSLSALPAGTHVHRRSAGQEDRYRRGGLMGRSLILAFVLAFACNLPPPTPPTPLDASDASPGPTPIPDPTPPAPPVLDAAPGASDACGRSYDHLLAI